MRDKILNRVTVILNFKEYGTNTEVSKCESKVDKTERREIYLLSQLDISIYC
jgi:hypothetical protein